MKHEVKKRLKVQLVIFLALFLVCEIVLRMAGMKAGTLIDDFTVEDEPVYQPRFISDEAGINRLIDTAPNLMAGTVVNKQGFRGNMDYTPEAVDSLRKHTTEKIVMLVGDSYVEGCCTDNVSNSFPDLLDRDANYKVLNFGVAGTDPLQYELLTKKYLGVLRPDVVVIAVYFGNDVLYYERKPTPGIPLSFPFKNNKWLYSIAPDHLWGSSGHVFSDHREAYTFFLDRYTLKGNNRNALEKTLSYSVILSKLYLYVEHTLAKRSWQNKNRGLYIDGMALTHKNLVNIESECKRQGVPYVFVGIPAPGEATQGAKLKEKYKALFGDIAWHVPVDLTLEDYDGASVANHFNNQGHRKYTVFLKSVLDKERLAGN